MNSMLSIFGAPCLRNPNRQVPRDPVFGAMLALARLGGKTPS